MHVPEPQSLEIRNILGEYAVFTNRVLPSSSVDSQEERQSLHGAVGLWDSSTHQLHLALDFVNNLWFLGEELTPMQENSN